MAQLLDCEPAATFEPTDPALTIAVSFSPIVLTSGGLQQPGISASWSANANPYLTGIQFETQPSDLSAGVTQSEASKAPMSWTKTDGIVSGGSYTVRYRAKGITGYGEWSDPETVVAPVIVVDGGVVGDETLPGGAIVRNDIQTLQASFTAAKINLAGTTPVLVQEVWIEVFGADTPVEVRFNGHVNVRHDPAGSFSITFAVYRSATAGPALGPPIFSLTLDGPATTNDSIFGMYPFDLLDNPGAGDWRYYMEIVLNVNNATTSEVAARYMRATEYRTNQV